MKKIPLKQLILAGIVTFVSCAHQGTPSGGPDDKISPSVLSSSPSSGAVNVPLKGRISITFSEWLAKKSDRGISVYPPFKFKVTVNKNRLDIIPIEQLNDSTTYHVSITTQLQDLHSNPILAPISLTFSTGPSLDSGTLSGCVIDIAKKELQPKIALFKKEHLLPDSCFFGAPDYLMQTDSSGHFEFIHLKNGSYYTIAFTDANSDNRIQPGTEPVYSTSDSLIAINSTTPQVFLFPSTYDTTRYALLNVKAQSATVLSGQWIVPFDLRSGYSYPSCTVELIDTPSVVIQGSYIALPNGKQFTLQLKSSLRIAPYRLIYTLRTPKGVKVTDSLNFNGVISGDTTKPALLSFTPLNKSTTDLEPEFRLIWSEPVAFNSPVSLIDSASVDTIILKSVGGYNDTTSFPLRHRLQPDRTYRMVIMQNMGNDIAGNLLKARDTTDTVTAISFKTINGDSLALSIQGEAACLDKSQHWKWIFKPLVRKASYIAQDNAGTFRFDSIPAGKGRLYYFNDLNGNDKPDIGRLSPWIGSEPHFAAPDTIDARARWEVEGVKVDVCEPCKKKPADSTATIADTTKRAGK